MNEEKIEIGGNSLLLWYGRLLARFSKYYENRSNKLIARGEKTVITNPSCKFASAFALVINFTVNNTDKYQLVTQGDYKDSYKEYKDKERDDSPLGVQEMFILIKEQQDMWFLKE